MSQLPKIHLGLALIENQIVFYVLTVDGIEKSPSQIKKYNCSELIPFGIELLQSLKFYCRAWKRAEVENMLNAVPDFIQEVYQIVLNRTPYFDDNTKNREALSWSLKVGERMTQMAFSVLIKKADNQLIEVA